MDFSKLLDLNYLFAPQTDGGFSWAFRLVLAALVLFSLAGASYAGIKQRKNIGLYKKGWQRWQIWGWANALLVLLLASFRETGAVYLGSRIWLLLWLVFSLCWAITILNYWRATVPTQAEEIRKREDFNKWLPKENRH